VGDDPDLHEPGDRRARRAHEAKLNSAFENGGPSLLIRTIEELSGLRVDNYVQIDFDGFQSMVNTLGGVEVCLSEPAKEKDSGIDLEAGRQTIKGSQALAFVRQRKGLPNGDIDRIGRQQQFIAGIVRKTLSAGTLLNPFRLNSVLNVATDALQVDDDTSIDDLRDLAVRFRTFTAGGVIFSTVPIADVNGYRERQSVVLLDEAKMAEQFALLRRDIAPDTPEAAEAAEASRPPSRSSSRRRTSACASTTAPASPASAGGPTTSSPPSASSSSTRRPTGQRGRPDDRLPRRRQGRLRPHRRRGDPRLAHRARPGADRHRRGRRRLLLRRREGRQRHARHQQPTADRGRRAPSRLRRHDRGGGPLRGLTDWTAGLAAPATPPSRC
jgi:LCP family protein required for cell wall assembly